MLCLSHAQPTSEKTPMNDLDNPVLLLFCHLVIRGKTQPTPKNIGSYVYSRALYIGICASASIPLDSYERMRPIYRLHMHGLPDGTPLRLENCQCIQYLMRAALPTFSFI